MKSEETHHNPPLDKEQYHAFEIHGAGVMYVSKSPHHLTGITTVGFGINNTNARYGERYGGVLGRADAIRLANHILEACGKVTETEEEEYNRRRNDRTKRRKFSDGVIKLFNMFSGGRLSTLENKN